MKELFTACLISTAARPRLLRCRATPWRCSGWLLSSRTSTARWIGGRVAGCCCGEEGAGGCMLWGEAKGRKGASGYSLSREIKGDKKGSCRASNSGCHCTGGALAHS